MADDLVFGQTRSDWSCGIEIRLPKDHLAKVDALRHTVERASGAARTGLFALAGGVALIGAGLIYRASK